MEKIICMICGLKERIQIVSLILAMAPVCIMHAQPYYKENSGYLLKEVDISAPCFFNRYKYGQILSFYSNYYIVSESTLQEFLNSDSVNYSQTIFLCDPVFAMFSDSTTSREIERFTRIKDILVLDDSEIYEIGKNKFFIRKIKYAYYDNTQVKVYVQGKNYYQWDDVSDEDTAILNTTYEVGQLYGREYYQCYHHLIEILPTPEYISKHLWRRLYQLGTE